MIRLFIFGIALNLVGCVLYQSEGRKFLESDALKYSSQGMLDTLACGQGGWPNPSLGEWQPVTQEVRGRVFSDWSGQREWLVATPTSQWCWFIAKEPIDATADEVLDFAHDHWPFTDQRP